MEGKQRGFTLIELLTVIAIIALLLSLAMPALNEARMRAREIGDKASLSSVNTAVETYAGDMHTYPDSHRRDRLKQFDGTDIYDPAPRKDQGAHRLMESLTGLDYLGFQKEHFYHVGLNGEPDTINMNTGMPEPTRRWGPYIKLESVTIDKMQNAHKDGTNWVGDLNDNPVFVDTLDVSESRPILYYKAKQSAHRIGLIYNYEDNIGITTDVFSSDSESMYPEFDEYDPVEFNGGEFERFIWDDKTGSLGPGSTPDPLAPNARPYNNGTFILINAGRDHKFGTPDDITNY